MKPSKALQNKNSLIEQISKFFDKDFVNQLARDTGFVQRQSCLGGIDFLFLCVFAHHHSDQISLEGLCGELVKEGKPITKQSLHERFNDNAVGFMQQLVNLALSEKLNTGAIARHKIFKRIIIWDSTAFELPEIFSDKYAGSGGGASTSALKLQYSYDLLSQSIHVLLVQSGTAPDNSQPLGEVKKTIYGLKT